MNKNTVVDKCLEHIPYRFELVVLASQRARMLYLGAKSPIEEEQHSSKLDLSLQEIATGVCSRESIIKSFKDSVEIFEDDIVPNELQTKDIKDGVSYDDFDINDEDDF